MAEASQDALRANAYKLLSDMFKYPEESFTENSNLIVNVFNELGLELGSIARQLVERRPQGDMEFLDGLQVEYSRLFVGPYQLAAAPYSSVYLDNQKLVMGESTQQVIDFYLAAGLDPSDENKEPPDHISTELEFMYYLLFNSVVKQDEKLLKLSSDFFTKHLNVWVPLFVDKLLEATDHEFYENLGKLLNHFTKLDCAYCT